MVLAGLGRITAQQGVDDDGVDFQDDASSNGGELELSQLCKLAPHLHLQRKREARLIIIGDRTA